MPLFGDTQIDSTFEVSVAKGSDGLFHLSITEGRSRAYVAEIRLTPEQFANAITAHVQTDVPGTLYPNERWGREMITTTMA